MPFFTPGAETEPRGGVGIAPPPPVRLPSEPGGVMDAALRQDNIMVSSLNALRNSGAYTPDPDHNPLDVIRGTKYEQGHLDNFVGSRSEAETRHIMGRIDAEDRDRQILDGAGAAGTVSQLIAGTVDPTIFLPGGAIYRTTRGGYSAARSALSVGTAAGAQATMQETILHATQETRPLAGSAVAVGSATLLGSLIGAGASRLLGRAEYGAMTAAVEKARADIDAHAGVAPIPEAAGAAATDTRANVDVEKVQAAAIKVGDKVFTGIIHSDAKHVAAASLKTSFDDVSKLPDYSSGFVTTTGRFVGRVEADKIVRGERFHGERVDTPEYMVRDIEFGIDAQDLPSLEQQVGIRKPSSTTGTPMAGSAGAAATDTRILEPVSTGLGAPARAIGGALEAVGAETVGGAFKRAGEGLVGIDPMSRVFGSSSVQARRATADLAETPLLMQQNLEGKPTTLNGPPVDRLARLTMNQTRIAVGDELTRLFSDMRFGEQKVAPRARAWFENKFGDGGMTFDAFKKEVSDAMINGDTHAIPQVQEAAGVVRKFFDTWGERAEAAIPEFKMKEFEDGGSYFPHLFNKTAIRQRRPEFTNVVVSHLKADQDVKAGIKTNLDFFNAQLQSWEKQISKLEARFGRAEERAKILDARAAERSRDDMPKTAGMNEADPTGRIAELQRRKVELSAEAKDLADAIDLMKELSGNPAIPAILKRSVDQLETRTITERIVGAKHQEAGSAGKRSEKRLAALEEQLDKTETRKDLIEEYLAVSQQFHDEVRAKIEGEIAKWQGASTQEAKAAIKARENAQKLRNVQPGDEAFTRLTGADSAIDSAVKRILESDRDLSIGELRDKANEITNHVLGSPDGRLPYDIASGGPAVGWRPGVSEPQRGSLHSRDFAIPTALIKDFIETDVEHVMNTHLRTVVPDVLIAEKFGDVRMTEALRKVEDEYAAKIDAAGPGKTADRLGKERDRIIGDMAAIRDRIRGVYGADIRAAMPMLARTVAAVKNYNVIASMGVAAISSLPDMAGAVFRHGLATVFNDAWSPYIQGVMKLSTASKEQARQLRAMGIMIETDTSMRHHELNDIMDSHKPESRVERSLQWGADKFQLVNLLAQWTDRMKAMAGGVAMAEILRATKAASEGKATARQLRQLGESNIDTSTADRIWKAFSEPGAGEVIDGVHLPNTDKWTDQQARLAFEAAVAREADIAVITPGQEKPLWLSNPVIGVLGQFKSFAAAGTTRTLMANLQRRDAQVLQGMLLSVALGTLSYKLNSLTGGQKTSDRPQDWIREGISRSGMLGWIEEGNALASKATGGAVDIYRTLGSNKPLSRYASRSAMDQLLGPTAGKIDSLLKVTSAVGRADWTEADTKALRRVTAMQNLFWLRQLIDKAEAGANGAFGIEMKPRP